MIKITKDTLEYLSIKTVYVILPDGKKVLCIPVELYADCWRVYIGTAGIESAAFAKLEILKTDNTSVSVSCKICRLEQKYKQYRLYLRKALPASMRAKIKSLETVYGCWEKRKDVRLKVGRKNYSLLGLKSAEQTVVIEGHAHTCIVEDISYQGVRLRFSYRTIRPRYCDDTVQILPAILGLKLTFLTPLCTVFLMLEPARAQYIDREKEIITAGCRIKEPVNLSFLTRVKEFAKKMEYGYVFQKER